MCVQEAQNERAGMVRGVLSGLPIRLEGPGSIVSSTSPKKTDNVRKKYPSNLSNGMLFVDRPNRVSFKITLPDSLHSISFKKPDFDNFIFWTELFNFFVKYKNIFGC